MGKDWRNWAARGLVGFVLIVNVQCAFLFVFRPDDFSAGFELSGVVGRVMVQSLGILFLMWNVPYATTCLGPLAIGRFVELGIMQGLGLAGEVILLWTLPAGHPQLQSTATRFIWFDSIGLGLIGVGLWFVLSRSKSQGQQKSIRRED